MVLQSSQLLRETAGVGAAADGGELEVAAGGERVFFVGEVEGALFWEVGVLGGFLSGVCGGLDDGARMML